MPRVANYGAMLDPAAGVMNRVFLDGAGLSSAANIRFTSPNPSFTLSVQSKSDTRIILVLTGTGTVFTELGLSDIDITLEFPTPPTVERYRFLTLLSPTPHE